MIAPKIYVVDDEPMIATTLVTILRMNGYSARAFTDGEEALASALADTPDLVISDIGMPGMSGIELASYMRSLCPTCKVLLLTGYGNYLQSLYDTRYLDEGIYILHKPLHPADLLREIKARGLVAG